MGESKRLSIGKEGSKMLMVARTGYIICEEQCKIKIHGSLFENY